MATVTTHTENTNTEELCINAIRILSMDGVQKANSGHPGTAMALAPLAYLLWTRYLRHNPVDPQWANRDRFVLSCGHASMLLYSLLHLSGYDVSLDDLKNFRQWNSKTPGHPEVGHTPGVETTTGPLGQGFANAVGMALGEKHLSAQFNQPGHSIIDHRVWFIVSDGDLMEGISHEAASLAGHWGLGKLIGFYDDNRITIEGATDLAFSEDTEKRFESYGWHVQRVSDGNDLEAMSQCIEAAERESDRPSLIIVRTHIAFGSPNKQDTSEAHGSPLGEKEIQRTRKNLGWPSNAAFDVPEVAQAEWRKCVTRGQLIQSEDGKRQEDFTLAFPDQAAELQRRLAGKIPETMFDDLPDYRDFKSAEATRKISGQVLNDLARRLPELMGGSADLAPSTNTLIAGEADFAKDSPAGRNLHFGIREHAMGAILNGMALHGGMIPYGATFLIFADYMRPSIRLAALMGLPVIYVFTHDSIGLGEDGPTHQPIEALAALRVIPNVVVLRPADAFETAKAWEYAIRHTTGPVALALSRQKLAAFDQSLTHDEAISRGGYVLQEAQGGSPKIVLMASGSEVSRAAEARVHLQDDGIPTRLVSMPSLELFGQQTEDYRSSVLPAGVPRLAVEAASPMPWEKWVGDQGAVMGLERFGASAPYEKVFDELGLSVDAIHASARKLLP